MASTNFINQQTVIQADWLNDVNSVTYDLLGNGTTIPASKSALVTSIGALGSANNLSDLGSAATARTNLGVTATGADATYLFRANNLSDLANAGTARTNLGLGSIATQASSSVSITGGSITGITDLAVADGGTGSSSLTANAVLLGNGTSALQTVAPGTNGNVLTSDGTTWQSTAPAVPSNYTLLGTPITPTVTNSVSLSGLTLTNYKLLYIVINNVAVTSSKVIFVSSTNIQTGGAWGTNTSTVPVYGVLWLDLTTGALSGVMTDATFSGSTTSIACGGSTNVTTASTAVYMRVSGANNFIAGGSISIYGVK